MKNLFLFLIVLFTMFSCKEDETILPQSMLISGESEIYYNKPVNYYVVFTPYNVTNRDVIWSSSNESVVTITEEGIVTAVNGGTATITATTTDGSNMISSLDVIAYGKPMVNIILKSDVKSYGATLAFEYNEYLNPENLYKVSLCIGNTSEPTIDNAVEVINLDKGFLSSEIEYLTLEPKTNYFFRAYYALPSGAFYGEELSFTTPQIDPEYYINESINQAAGAGIVKCVDEYVFYRNYDDYGKLYRYNIRTNKNIKILDYKWVFSIHQYGNYLIMGCGGESTSDDNYILKCKFDGSDLQILKDNATSKNLLTWDSFVIVDDYIYLSNYSNSNFLGKYNLTTNTYTNMSTWAFSLNVEGDYVYYKNWLSEDIYDIKRTNINTNSTEVLLTYNPDAYLNRVLFYKNTIYFFTTDGLLGRFSVENPDDLTFYDAKVYGFTIYDDYIYYINGNDNSSLHKMDLTESVKIKLNSTRSNSWLSVFNDRIFYIGEDNNLLYSINIDGANEQIFN